jgi:hypothetical protein
MKFYGKDKKEYSSYIELLFKKSFDDVYNSIDDNKRLNKARNENHGFIIKINPDYNTISINQDDKLLVHKMVLTTYMNSICSYNNDNELIENIIHILEAMLNHDKNIK